MFTQLGEDSAVSGSGLLRRAGAAGLQHAAKQAGCGNTTHIPTAAFVVMQLGLGAESPLKSAVSLIATLL